MPAAVAYIAGNVATWVSGAVYSGLQAVGVSAAAAATASSYAATLAAGAVYATAYLAPALLAPRPSPPSLESGKEPINQARPPRRYGAGGSQRLGGPRLLFASIRDYGLDVVAHCEGPVVSYPQTWLHDDEVTPDGTTGVVAALSDGSYGKSKVSVHGRLGQAGQTAISELTAIAGTLWTSSAKATGVAISAAIFGKTKDDELLKIYRLGRPKLSRRVVFAFYDWRKDSTAGGSGAHRRDNPATWEASRNPVVCFVHNEVFRFGQSWDRRFAPVLAELTVEADYCDALVATAAGGTEPRYQIDGSYTADQDRANVRRWYLETMDGSLWRRPDGAIVVRAGRYIPPDFTLPARHVIQINWTRGVQKARRVNQLTGSYLSPAHAWTEQQADAWRDDAAIADYGLVSDGFDRPWVGSHDQWRRLAKRAYLRRQVAATGSIIVNLWGLNWSGQRWITLDPVPGAPPSLAGGVELEVLGVRKIWPLRVVFDVALSTGAAIDAFNAVTEGGTAPGAVAPPALLTTPVPDILSASSVSSGDMAVLSVAVDPAYSLGLAGLRFGLRWRELDGGNGPEDNWSSPTSTLAPDDATSLSLISPLLPAGLTYEVSINATSGGIPSDWSGPTEVGTSVEVQAIASLLFPSGPFRVGVAAANQIGGLADWTYGRTGTGYAANADGSQVSFAADVPRISNRGLLIEAAATNLLLRSQEIDNASWSKFAAGTGVAPVVTANAATAPDGTTTADQVVFDLGASNTLSDQSMLNQGVTVANATAYAGSVWLKASSAVTILCRHVGSGSYSLLNVTTAWQRFVVPETSVTTTPALSLGLRGLGAATTATVNVWGVQLELGATATSYVPTVAATVTRPADAATLALPSGDNADPIEVISTGGTVSTTRGTLANPLILDLGGASGGAWVGQYITSVTVSPV